MKTVIEYIGSHEQEFARHPLFARLERDASIEDLTSFAFGLAFWSLSFQDVLRLNEERFADRTLQDVARAHRRGDAGHERWFLRDLVALGRQPPSLEWAFGQSHLQTRDAAFAVIAEVFAVESDAARIAIVLMLEATAHWVLPRINECFARAGVGDRLHYFGKTHVEAENGHELFDDATTQLLTGLGLSDGDRREAMRAADRVRDAVTSVLDGIHAGLAAAEHGPRTPRAAQLQPGGLT